MKCYLKCNDGRHDPLEITDDKETFIGRLKATSIKDVMCSRNQVSLKADFSKLNVAVKQLGINSSGINGFALKKDQIYELFPGDILEILLGKYGYEVVFEANTTETTVETESRVPREVQETNLDDVWESIDGGKCLIFTSSQVKGSSKIASYDLDGTIIETKSGKRFAQDLNDWRVFPYVSGKLTNLHQDGYKIVFFTNQNGISVGKVKVEEFKTKIQDIVKSLKNIPIQVFIATGKTIYRKPMIGMWNYLSEHKNRNIKINKQESLFVGDAAGRPANALLKTKKDHSSADRLFALNIGIKFFTPEEHFKKHSTATWVKPLFDPKVFLTQSSLLNPPHSCLASKELEVILMVGAPGSGKSTFAKTHLVTNGYKWINQDTLKSWQNCIKQLESTIREKQNAVIDNTNPDKETRKRYIEVAKKLNIKCRCFVMDISFAHSKHNNLYRELTDPTHKPVNEIVMNTFNKRYEAPEIAEGFSEVVKVNLIPKFENEKDEELYRMYLLDS